MIRSENLKNENFTVLPINSCLATLGVVNEALSTY